MSYSPDTSRRRTEYGSRLHNTRGIVCRTMAAAAWFALLISCQSTPEAQYDFDDSRDYSLYSSFSWISDAPLSFHNNSTHASPMLEERLKEAAKEAFQQRGLTFTEDRDEADLLISFTVGSRDRILLEGYPQPSVYVDAYNDGTYWVDNSRLLGQFVEGQVCIDLFDRKSGYPVWHGTVREPISEQDVDFWREQISGIVATIAKGYPPGPKGN